MFSKKQTFFRNCNVIYFSQNQMNLTNLLKFWALVIPTTDLVVASEHVHGHHTDGKCHRPHNNFPGMGGHKEAMHTEKSWQHCSHSVPGSWRKHHIWTFSIQLTFRKTKGCCKPHVEHLTQRTISVFHIFLGSNCNILLKRLLLLLQTLKSFITHWQPTSIQLFL